MPVPSKVQNEGAYLVFWGDMNHPGQPIKTAKTKVISRGNLIIIIILISSPYYGPCIDSTLLAGVLQSVLSINTYQVVGST